MTAVVSPLARRSTLHDLKLNLLDFRQPLPLPRQDVVDFFMQVPDLEFGLQIDPVIVFGTQTIFRFLSLLAHHDDRRLNGGKARQHQIEKDEWIGIKLIARGYDHIKTHPDKENEAEDHDEGPASAE